MSGSPSQLTVIQIGKVSDSARPMKAHAAKNLPSTACHSVTGWVSNNSRVPDLRSSAHSPMATAGTSSTAHNSEMTGVAPESDLDYALRCAESVTGIIQAAVLMRPTGFDGLAAGAVLVAVLLAVWQPALAQSWCRRIVLTK